MLIQNQPLKCAAEYFVKQIKTLNFPAEHFANLSIPIQTLICTREHFVNLLIQKQQLKCTDSHLLLILGEKNKQTKTLC